jgi:hypothetical protein
MLRPVRGSSAPPHGVRFPLLLVSWISITASALAATCASAASSEWLPADPPQAGSDSVASPEIQPPTPATPTYVTPAPVSPTLVTPKAKAYGIHLHGGLFAPIDVNATSPTLGLRLARRLGSHLQGGLLVGWTLERKNLEQPIDGLPGLPRHLILARAYGHLVPAMAFLQVNLTEKRFLAPFAGIAAGYEWFILQGDDYRTGETASATYENLAWESWGGIGMRLDPNLRVDFELFYNGGSLERDVTDSSGQSWREAVDVNGVGARVGLDILF